MNENGNFRRLSQNLEHDEKLALLQKLQANTIIQDEALVPPPVKKEESDIETLYLQLPWYKKLLFYILSFFLGKTKEDIFLGRIIADWGREIEVSAPGMYDWENNLLLPQFLKELVELKEAARFFSSVLDSGVLTNYGMFLIYLGSLEMPEIHEQLQRIANPVHIYKENPKLSDVKLKKIALGSAENVMDVISTERRGTMYNNARSLFCLKELAFFLFDRLILGFQTGTYSQGAGQICPFSVAKAQLTALNNLFFSFRRMPSMSLLSSMYVFVVQNEHQNGGLDNEREIKHFISGAEKALFTIRNFANRVPLTRIIRCGLRDLKYEPFEVAGSEEWFSIYCGKWIGIITENFNEFIVTKRKNELSASVETFFQGKELEEIEYVQDDKNPEGVPVKGALMLSFLMTFHKYIFMGDMNNFLRPILIDGEFYKRENRISFTESYNELLKIDDLIITIARKITPSGEWGKQWKQINAEIQSLAVKHRKLGLFLEEISLSVGQIVQTSKSSLLMLENIIGGILQPDAAGGKYDSLSNLAKIAGKGTEFTEGLQLALKNIKSAIWIIKTIEQLESTD